MIKRSGLIVFIYGLFSVLGPIVYAQEMKQEIGIGVAIADVDGQDSGFPLDGDIDVPTLYYGLGLSSGLTFDVRIDVGDGEFKLSTGEKTDYEYTSIDIRIGRIFCLSESCHLKIRPYVGYNRFSSENELLAFGTSIEVDQKRTKIPLGANFSITFGKNEIGLDLQTGYKSDESQDISVLGIDQDADGEWSPRVEVYARHTFANRLFLEAEYSYVEDDFDQSGGNRSASEETSAFMFSIGKQF